MLAGNDVKSTAKVFTREVLTLTEGKITLSKAPLQDSLAVFAEGDDCGTKIEATASGAEVTITGGSDGDKYILFNYGSTYLPRDKQSHLYIAYHRGMENILKRVHAKYPDLVMQACACLLYTSRCV